MHDIRLIRDDPVAFDAGLARRGLPGSSAEILALDQKRRELETTQQDELAGRNARAKAIGEAKRAGNEELFDQLRRQAEVAQDIGTAVGDSLAATASKIRELLSSIPNLPASDVPNGLDESDNIEQKRIGEPRSFAFAPRQHDEFAGPLGLDFESATAIAGARFAVLRGPIARLNRALGQFMLDVQTQEQGYAEIAPPLLVRDEAMFGTGQLPKFADDLFRTTDGRWLIPTAEVSLTNLVRERILAETDLPLRFAALTPCFRSEAGAAGRDTRGMIRQHQFDKVELVSITTPDASDAEHERMTHAAEAILEKLELPYRRMLLCTGDMGFSARKTYDLEVWLPGQDRYREISSCSNCGDFQARRMDARYGDTSQSIVSKITGGKGARTLRFVHTLNGSGLAVGRALVAVLENYQQADGSIRVPEALLPYMGGVDTLAPVER